MLIPSTYAPAIFTLCVVDPKEPITVNYANDYFYFKNHYCACVTCNPNSPLLATKHSLDLSKFIKRADGKRTWHSRKREK